MPDALPVLSDPYLGRVLDGIYVLEEHLGSGAYGAVYRARHQATGGAAAVKLLRPERAGDAGVIRRFTQEARNLHRLSHPNSVRLAHFGHTSDGILYLVMEHVSGRTLAQALATEGRLGPARAVRIIEQVLKSLGEAHALQIVHRDVKPANLMLCDEFGEPDFVKVLDFGVSRDLDASGAGTHGAIGTPTYMAPEVWSGEIATPAADLYAVGCVLYQMLAGEPPFRVVGGASSPAMGLMFAHLHHRPAPLAQAYPGLCPAPLAHLVDELLAKAPGERPPDAAAVLTRLAEIRGDHPLDEAPVPRLQAESAATETQEPPAASFAPTEARTRPSARRPVAWAALAVIATATAAAVAWWAGERPTPPSQAAPALAQPAPQEPTAVIPAEPPPASLPSPASPPVAPPASAPDAPDAAAASDASAPERPRRPAAKKAALAPPSDATPKPPVPAPGRPSTEWGY